MAEDGKFSDGYEAIFGKGKKPAAPAKATAKKPAAKPAAKAGKKPAAKKK
jgi:hypothetical protein